MTTINKFDTLKRYDYPVLDTSRCDDVDILYAQFMHSLSELFEKKKDDSCAKWFSGAYTNFYEVFGGDFRREASGYIRSRLRGRIRSDTYLRNKLADFVEDIIDNYNETSGVIDD